MICWGPKVLTEDDGVNDEDAFRQACEKLEAEGFFDEARRKYGLGYPDDWPVSSNKSISPAVVESSKDK
jgi:hypothetical protein